MLLHKAYLDIPLHKIFLSPGSTGAAVYSLQTRLNQLGFYSEPPSGVYDNATQKAISLFQQANCLPADGVTHWNTYLLLWRDAGTEVAQVERTKLLGTADAAIHIARGSRTLSLYLGNSLAGQYSIAIGKPGTPTPLGNYAIATKVHNPGGILGTRWLGLNYDTYGIHGTNRPWLIGQAVSLGCIRMNNADVEKVYNTVRLGTPVLIRD